MLLESIYEGKSPVVSSVITDIAIQKPNFHNCAKLGIGDCDPPSSLRGPRAFVVVLKSNEMI